jgi:DNA-binding NarL/FixJ family response regulator
MADIKVLLVDDHALIRSGIRSILDTSYNIKVVEEFNNGKEVVTYLDKNAALVDVVLMDITMPIMDGVEASEIIRKRHPKIRILALTMHMEEPYIMKMMKVGALGYILKDSTREKIIEAINCVYGNEKYYSNEVSIKLINALMKEVKDTELILSERELQILKLISTGVTNKKIGDKLSISDRTVESHRWNMMKKLSLKNSAELVKYAIFNDLV